MCLFVFHVRNTDEISYCRCNEILHVNFRTFSVKYIIFRNILWFISIIVQRDATQSSLFIILHVHSTCSGCQPYPSSGVHKTVTTASGTGKLVCSYLQLGHVGGR